MDHPVTAVYDANVLYPAPLRDLFIRLAQAGLVRARWTEAIHDEWVRNILKDNPALSPDRLARTRALMNEAVRDCLVTGYEDLIESLSLPDPDDRHVLCGSHPSRRRGHRNLQPKGLPGGHVGELQRGGDASGRLSGFLVRRRPWASLCGGQATTGRTA